MAASEGQERVSLQLIASKLERLTWHRRLWGVDERQVWHVVQRMDEMYQQLYREQEVRYQALLSSVQAQGQSQPQQAPVFKAGPAADSTAELLAAQAQAQQRTEPPYRYQPLQQPQTPRTPGSHRFRTS